MSHNMNYKPKSLSEGRDRFNVPKTTTLAVAKMIQTIAVNKKKTLEDIAKEVGVSSTTIWIIINRTEMSNVTLQKLKVWAARQTRMRK